MQSDVSHGRSKVDVSAAVGGHYTHVKANQECRRRAVGCLGSRACLCLSTVSPLLLSSASGIGMIEATWLNTGGNDQKCEVTK